jgi:hypothetical protein
VRIDGILAEDAAGYEHWLDLQTDEILSSMPDGTRPWGTVRKAMNLFMRACISDHYLRANLNLDRYETWAELPLDSIVAIALKRAAGRGQLPQWPGLKHLDRETHKEFQEFALRYTQELELPARIFLDYRLWLKGR